MKAGLVRSFFNSSVTTGSYPWAVGDSCPVWRRQLLQTVDSARSPYLQHRFDSLTRLLSFVLHLTSKIFLGTEIRNCNSSWVTANYLVYYTEQKIPPSGRMVDWWDWSSDFCRVCIDTQLTIQSYISSSHNLNGRSGDSSVSTLKKGKISVILTNISHFWAQSRSQAPVG